MDHYTHLTKIKAHHTHHKYMYMQNVFGFLYFFNDDHEEREKVHENRNIKNKKYKKSNPFYENTNRKLYKSKEGKTIAKFYTFCVKLSGEREKKRKEKKKRKNKKYKEVFKVA